MKEKPNAHSLELYKRLVGFLRPYLGRLFFGIFCSVIVGLIATSPVPLIQKTFDDIFVKKDFLMLKLIPLALVGLYLIKGAFSYAQNIIIFGISWELVVAFRKQMFAHIQRLPLAFFESSTTGQLISRVINDVTIMQSSVTNLVKEFLQNFIMLVGLLGWVFYLKWDWAAMALLIFPLAIAPISNIGRKLRRLSRKGQEILGDINSTILETFAGIKVVRGFALEKLQEEKLRAQNDEFLQVMKKNVKYIEIPSPLMEFLGMVSGATVLWYGGGQVLTGAVTQGTFIAFIVALFMMYGPLRLLFKIYVNFQNSLAGAERVFHILDQETESGHLTGQRELREFKSAIEFRAAAFRYPTRDAWVLNGIDLTVAKGEIIAIVGMSGAGKTTLVDLLFRFFEVTRGRILIDGVDIREMDVYSLRKKLSLVTQDTFLFNDTIKRNIAFGKEDATDEEILRAAQAAYVDHFVARLDDGYATVIGERGVKLSGGQRQRLAIARAILRDAPILVLDEATSALDSESEKLVQEALHRLMANRTTFLIAHRLSTIKHADRIIVLDQGAIVEEGTHEQLLAHCGIYQKYYEMQVFDHPR